MEIFLLIFSLCWTPLPRTLACDVLCSGKIPLVCLYSCLFPIVSSHTSYFNSLRKALEYMFASLFGWKVYLLWNNKLSNYQIIIYQEILFLNCKKCFGWWLTDLFGQESQESVQVLVAVLLVVVLVATTCINLAIIWKLCRAWRLEGDLSFINRGSDLEG